MADTNALCNVIEKEHARHPRMNVRDLQKMIYQSVFGGDHLLADPERFARDLHEEWARLPEGGLAEDASALQAIDPEGKTMRIHLDACKRREIDVDRLIELLAGQRWKNGSRSDYERWWSETIVLAEEGRIPFSADELARIDYPESPPHHDLEYGFASYRIVNDASDPEMVEGLRRLGVR